jgi:hypothetical protein
VARVFLVFAVYCWIHSEYTFQALIGGAFASCMGKSLCLAIDPSRLLIAAAPAHNALPTQCLLERDAYVMEACLDAGVPLACVIGGGYDTDAAALARRHAIVFQAAARVWRGRGMAHLPSWQ